MSKKLREISVKIRRRETPFQDTIYRFLKRVRAISFPTCKPFHSFLYNEWCLRRISWHSFWRVVYYEPMFKSQCEYVGSNFCMEYAGNGSTTIVGNLKVSIGDNVTIFDNTIFVGLKVKDNPTLTVGENTYLGPAVRFFVGDNISIGRNCMIVSRLVTDNPGHSVNNVMERLKHSGGSPEEGSLRPVTIGDFCFLPMETIVYPGVTIGDGVVAKIGTHINRDVPPFCQVAGNPMVITKKLPIPSEIEEVVGPERYQQYLACHQNLEL